MAESDTATFGSLNLYPDSEAVAVSGEFRSVDVTPVFRTASMAMGVSYTNLFPTEVTLGNFIVTFNLADTVGVSAALGFERGKGYDTPAAVADTIALGVTFGTADSAFAADTVGVGLGKVSIDAAGVSDSRWLATGKGAADTAGATDAARFDAAIQLTSGASVTDDVNGAAAGDDSAIQFFKATSNAAGVADELQIAAAYSRPQSDTASVIESTAKGVSTTLANTAGVGDSILVAIIVPTNPFEVVALSDGMLRAVGMVRGDAAGVTDVAVLSLGVLRDFSDTGAAADASIVSAGKVFNDSGRIADTGSLRSQGYADFSYFAEDYVGESRTFT